ncbi:MAG: NIL domain-containing protein [Bacillota bacterium]
MRTRVVLRFPADRVEQPITYHLIRDYGVRVNILRARVNPGEEGTLLLEIEAPDTELAAALEFAASEGVEVTPLAKQVLIDADSCIDCGACTAVCVTGALQLDTGYRLAFDPGRCVACELCVGACPLRAIEVTF